MILKERRRKILRRGVEVKGLIGCERKRKATFMKAIYYCEHISRIKGLIEMISKMA